MTSLVVALVAPEGAGPSSILSDLPDGAGPITAIVVAVCAVLAAAIPFLGRLLPDRSTQAPVPLPPTRDEIAALQSSIGRLETQLREAQDGVREAQGEVRAIQSKYEAEKERSHGLEMQLAAASQRLERADDELAGLRAQLAMVLRPLHQEPPRDVWAVRRVPRAPWPDWARRDVDDAPTDPIREGP